MKAIELDTHFGDKPVHIEISAPMVVSNDACVLTHSISCIKNLGFKELIGNITKVIRQGKEQHVLCFAAEESVIPRLERINEYLSEPKKIFYSPNQP